MTTLSERIQNKVPGTSPENAAKEQAALVRVDAPEAGSAELTEALEAQLADLKARVAGLEQRLIAAYKVRLSENPEESA